MNLALLFVLQSPTAVMLNPSAVQGTWEGWGTSLCWMGKAFGDRSDLADLLFTTKQVVVNEESLPGLGLNIVRYNAGACSWNVVNGRRIAVSKTIQPYRQMEGFWTNPHETDPSSKGWDWAVDGNQRAMMQAAKKRGADHFELFSNSPMWWMCANLNPSGAPKATLDNLAPNQTQAFCRYLAEVARKAERDWGIKFTSIEPFNEPLSSWWDANCKQEGCHFSIPGQLRVLPRLRSELDSRGLRRLQIVASDETYVSQALQAWQGYGSRARALVSRVNVHGYEGETSPRIAFRSALGSKALWVSEHGENDSTGLSLARELGLDIRDLHPTAWCYWQPCDGGGWGLMNSDVANGKIYHSSPKYFVLAQYTRHIRPGMQILRTGSSELTAAIDGEAGKLVVVISNFQRTAVHREIDLCQFSSVSNVAKRWLTKPTKGVFCRDEGGVPIVGKCIDLLLPPLSIQTLEIPIHR